MSPSLNSVDALIARVKARERATAMDARPRLRTVILTCMDARIDPSTLFGLKPGEVHILRNAGALATPDVLRSLAVSQALLGTREVLVLAHTQCGLLGRTEEEVAGIVERASGHAPHMPMGSFHDVEAAVRKTVEAIRTCEFLGHRDVVRGYVLDVADGSVRALDGPHGSDHPIRSPRSSVLGLGALRADVLNLKRPRI
jgi:carbonic anhydrase